MKTVILTVLLLISASVMATEDSYEFDTPQQRQLFLSLTEELRCPMCQNQNRELDTFLRSITLCI